MIKCNIMMFNDNQICLELVAAASNLLYVDQYIYLDLNRYCAQTKHRNCRPLCGNGVGAIGLGAAGL
jgi:hypothetical protein